MALSQNLVQKQTQRLVITQDLRQSIELLALSTLELSEKIQKELLENPLLDSAGEFEGEAPDVQEASGKEEKPQQDSPEANPDENEGEWWRDNVQGTLLRDSAQGAESSERKQQFLENTLSSPDTLAEHLLWQLRLSSLSEEEVYAGELVLSAIDNRGFFTESIENLIQDTDVTPAQIQKALEQIQALDPIGCGARDIAESLFIQASILKPEDTITQELLKNHLEDLERLDYKKIEKKTGFTREQMEESIKFIRTLEPYPGTLHSSKQPDYIVPDIIILEVDGNPEIIINDEWMPALQINEDYKNLLKGDGATSGSEADKEYLQSKLNSAVWMIKSIRQRRATLYKVTSSILEFQREFFKKGSGHLVPLTLRDVAEKVDLHESTVSRITTNKYVQTRWGVFELKYFFSSSLNSNTGGQKHSARSIQDRIKQLIDEEDQENPLSDQDIMEKVRSEGVQIARRTVAKYRKILKILPADRRKKLKKLNQN